MVAFADVGDGVTVAPAERLSLTVSGPFAGALDGQADNLIIKALRALGQAAGIGEPGLAVTLDKRLPIAAGLGGGSSDAGAALRLADAALGLGLGQGTLAEVSRVVGADGPMCLHARSAWAEGVGDRLEFAPDLPAFHAVLANPGRPSSTGAVYRAYDEGPIRQADRPSAPDLWTSGDVVDWLSRQRNDLEEPAKRLEPAIAAVLSAMAGTGADLVRMSGSGATVFGLFQSEGAAEAAAGFLRRAAPGWWIVRTVLGESVADQM